MDARRTDIEQQLERKTADIASSFELLRDEVSLRSISVKKVIEERPMAMVATVAGLGLVVGWVLFAGRSNGTRGRRKKVTSSLVEPYVDRILTDVVRRTERGEDVDKAVRAALDQEPPIVSLGPRSQTESGRSSTAIQAMLENTLESALRVAISQVVRYLKERFFTAREDVEE